MIFRFTKNALDYVNSTFEDDVPTQNRYLDWFVDIFVGLDKKKYFLITNAARFFPSLFLQKGLQKKSRLLTAPQRR